MATSLGRFLRKLRIDRGEILKDMADKLGVSVSFLSSVENGKKQMPSTWNQKICQLYELNEKQKEEFTNAIAETQKAIEMNLYQDSLAHRKLAISFARKLSEMDEVQISKIAKILKEVKIEI